MNNPPDVGDADWTDEGKRDARRCKCSRTDYEGVLDEWKVQLIVRRAKRMGFRGLDLDDAVQQVVLTLIDFEIPESWLENATEKTTLTAVIDRRLAMIRRSESRSSKREDVVRANRDEACDSIERTLSIDVTQAMQSLSELDRKICRGLSEGRSVNHLAQQLDMSWHTMKSRIAAIRRHFERRGFSESYLTNDGGRAGMSERTSQKQTEQDGPLLLSAQQAAAMCGKSIRTWRNWDSAGLVPRPVRIRRSTLWRWDELRAMDRSGLSESARVGEGLSANRPSERLSSAHDEGNCHALNKSEKGGFIPWPVCTRNRSWSEIPRRGRTSNRSRESGGVAIVTQWDEIRESRWRTTRRRRRRC